ncbi:MAG: hypothetical protein ACYTEZ_10750 [Planctomycetota bacterium]
METTEALLLVGAVLLVFAAVYFVARNEIVKRRLTCPRSGSTAEVEVLRRFEGRQKPVRVKSCSLFEDPKQVECEQDCLEAES